MSYVIETYLKNKTLDYLGGTGGLLLVLLFDNNDVMVDGPKAITWDPATNGVMTESSGSISFSVPATTTLDHATYLFYNYTSYVVAATYAALGPTGTTGVLYIVKEDETQTGQTAYYKWDGSNYVQISEEGITDNFETVYTYAAQGLFNLVDTTITM